MCFSNSGNKMARWVLWTFVNAPANRCEVPLVEVGEWHLSFSNYTNTNQLFVCHKQRMLKSMWLLICAGNVLKDESRIFLWILADASCTLTPSVAQTASEEVHLLMKIKWLLCWRSWHICLYCKWFLSVAVEYWCRNARDDFNSKKSGCLFCWNPFGVRTTPPNIAWQCY